LPSSTSPPRISDFLSTPASTTLLRGIELDEIAAAFERLKLKRAVEANELDTQIGAVSGAMHRLHEVT